VRVAFVGKGGSGKSAIAGTVVRALAADGQRVLAIDSDPMPGLAWTIGLTPTDEGFPDEVTEEGPPHGPRWQLRHDLTPEDAVERYATVGPDGIHFIQFGKLRGHVGGLQRSQHAFNQIAKGITDDRWHLVGDLPAGTRQAFFGWASYADLLLVVVEPTVKSVISARRLARMADPAGRREGAHVPRVVAVANKVAGDDDVAMIARRTGLEVRAAVPFDEAFAAAERLGRPPFDAAADSPAVRAVASLAHDLAAGDPAAEEVAQ
jgi:CO dehydrogenase maturation factor